MGDLCFDIGDLPSSHELGTLCSNSRPSKGWLESCSCVGVVTLLEDHQPLVVLLHLKGIDLLDQSDVLFQNSLILLRVVDGVVLQLLSECFDVVLEVVSLRLVLKVGVTRANIALILLQYPHFVESDAALLQFLEVHLLGEDCLVDIILKLSLSFLLLGDGPFHLACCLSETFLPHAEIIDDQHKVLVDSVEVLLLRPHLISLLVQLLNLDLSWTNVSFELLDLVIKHEFEFFKLLNFLLEVQNSNLFLLKGHVSLSNLGLLQLDVLLELDLVLLLCLEGHLGLHEVSDLLLFMVAELRVLTHLK